MTKIKICLDLVGTVFSLGRSHGFIFFFLLVMLLYSCQGEEKEAPKASAVEVTVIKAESKTIPVTFEWVGQTESSRLVEIRARVEGFLDKIAYKEGDLVNEGALLFQIDPRPFKAALESAKGILAQEEARLLNARREFTRVKPLFEQNAVSERYRDNSEAAMLAAEASVQSAKANVVESELDLSYTTIKSPLTGLTSRSRKREGALVTPGQDSLLTTVEQLDPIWVNFSISENEQLRYKDEVEKNKLRYPANMDFDVELVLADGSIYPYTGKVNFAEPSISRETGTRFIRAELPNPDDELKPGQFVRARLKGAVRPSAILVPQKAVIQGANGNFVYVVNEEKKAEFRAVEVGDWHGNDWFITSGLSGGELVVVDGAIRLSAGAPVKIVEGSGQPPQDGETSKKESPTSNHE